MLARRLAAPATYTQRDQPAGVPPLSLTGERTLPDVPAENYWYRRHLAVYRWIAERVRGLDVVDTACGEGYGTAVLAERAARVTGVDANPEAHEHARLKYSKPGVRFVRALVGRGRSRTRLPGGAPMSDVRERGELALVLHSHMPYVEGFGTWPFGEEWLWEALASVYLPMLRALREAPITLGLTPVLCDQLEALEGEAGERFLGFLREVRAGIHAEDATGLERGGELELAAEVRRAATDYREADRVFTELQGRVLPAFADLAARGPLELWTSSATHAVLPLIATDAGLRLQVSTGVRSHERRFGDGWSGGFWLPECAYRAGLERELAEYGNRAFCVDQTEALGLGSLEQLEPIPKDARPLAVPID